MINIYFILNILKCFHQFVFMFIMNGMTIFIVTNLDLFVESLFKINKYIK